MKVPHYMTQKIEVDNQLLISTTPPRLLGTSQNYRWATISKWNNLPDNLKRQSIMKKFKIGIKQWIRENRDNGMNPEPEPVLGPEPAPTLAPAPEPDHEPAAPEPDPDPGPVFQN